MSTASSLRAVTSGVGVRFGGVGVPGISTRCIVFLAAVLCMTVLNPATVGASEAKQRSDNQAAKSASIEARLRTLEQRVPAPELGQQMLGLQIRHDRLWWAGEAGDWSLAYYMAGELGEALRSIEATNGEAPEMQPQKLSELMPAIMNPAIRAVQQALEQRNKSAFARAYGRLSAACNACHKEAGVGFLYVQRPKAPLPDNLRDAPLKGK